GAGRSEKEPQGGGAVSNNCGLQISNLQLPIENLQSHAHAHAHAYSRASCLNVRKLITSHSSPSCVPFFVSMYMGTYRSRRSFRMWRNASGPSWPRPMCS